MMQSRWIRRLLIGASLAGCADALALDTTPPPAPPPNGVSIGWMVYVPATLTVAPGTTVTWKNWDESDHTVQFADQKSPRIIPNASYSRTFSTAGEYPYHCWLHGMRMAGTIVVK